MSQAEEAAQQQARQRWMGVLARAPAAALEKAWAALETRPDYDFLRRPEIGMVMVRARAGGSGQQFNLGEMTVTRCTLRLAGTAAGPELAGSAYVAGRDTRKAELAAAFDALLQDPDRRPLLLATLVEPLAAEQAAARQAAAARAAASKVEFFTVAREAGTREDAT